MRSILKAIIVAPALVLSAACSKDKSADPSLNNDLSLAAQANPNARLDSISAAERMNGTATAPATGLRSSSAPVAAPTRRTSTSAPARRTGSSSGSSAGTSSGTVASEPRVVTKKNTKRDAAIGAAAGAIIGATTSRDKVKGGIIGAAAGGILGGVIGNNVDIQKKKTP
jgi:cobalamin biosynthesis Mg chelatase CobN